MKKLKFIAPRNDLNEIYQQIDLKFALVNIKSDEIKVLTNLVKCRDYLSDALVTTKTGVVLERQYGFRYEPSNTEMWDISESINFLLKIPSEYEGIFKGNLFLLNDLEEWYGWDLTTVEHVKEDYFLLTGDKRWTTSIFMISLYSFLLRTLCEANESISPDIQTHLTYVATLDGRSKNNALLSDTVIKSNVPIWAIIQHLDDIHENADVVGEENFTITPAKVGVIHDYGGMKRFFEHIIAYRDGASKDKGANSMYCGHKLAWNYFQLETSDV